MKINRKNRVSVQFVPGDDTDLEEKKERLKRVREYFTSYCKGAPLNISMYWGTTRDFVVELKQQLGAP